MMHPIQRTATEIVKEDDLQRVETFWATQGYRQISTLKLEGEDAYCVTYVKVDTVFREMPRRAYWSD